MERILIANRGEIAVRVIRTAHAQGYETVAVFSEADADAPHVELADQAVCIGPAEVGQSYLNMDSILDAAERSGADAIHPGYGFLSENPIFAQKVLDAGLTWIGPSPNSMDIMGNKAAAKLAIADAAVPTIPGYSGDDQSDEAFIAAAESAGYPVMVKAAAGGGGRGMRLVQEPDALPAALASARSEAQKAFGSDELLLEKAIVNPRHIEIQVFGDTHGNVIHLGERDCSIQRRHQKVFEEAPSPAVDADLRQKIGAAAVEVAKAVDYTGAGTVEFLMDQHDDFYFIEMNTRLQVEHPVTEMITGQDLVAWQFAIAEGLPLPLSQDDVTFSGHAIEIRLYAEDPQNGFLPAVGPVLYWQPPADVRVDHGLRSGMTITPFYDAMIAKIIVWGETREIARRKLIRALKQTVVFGLITNRRFLIETAAHPVFANGEATTSFIDTYWEPSEASGGDSLSAYAALLYHLKDRSKIDPVFENWHSRPTTLLFDPEKKLDTALVTPNRSGFEVKVGDSTTNLSIVAQSEHALRVEQNKIHATVHYTFEVDGKLWLQQGALEATFDDHLLNPPASGDAAGSGRIIAPMPGSVLRVDVQAGEAVEKGQALIVLEAMKMEHTISAPFDGKVEEVLVAAGQQMKPKELMLVVEAAS